MKKTIIIIIGAVFLLLLIGIWAYLFFVGTPESVEEIFSDLNAGSEPAAITPTDDAGNDEENSNSDTETTQDALRQLTTTPVAGFTFLTSASSSNANELLYAEKGTGHIYHYNLTNQQRTRISNKTVPTTHGAYIDTDGQYAILETNDQLQVVQLSEATSTDITTMAGTHQNIHLGAGDTLHYTQTDTTGTTAYTYDIATGNETAIFTVPMQDVRVLWNETGAHHLYNATAETLPSYLYRVEGSTLYRTPITGKSLEVMYGPEANSFIYTTQEEQERPSSTYWTPENEQRLSGILRPEKCTIANSETFCAYTITDTTNVTEWYRGSHAFADTLWQIDHNRGSSGLLVNFRNTSGRDIDVDAIQVDNTATTFLLRNKHNGYLWTYTKN